MFRVIDEAGRWLRRMLALALGCALPGVALLGAGVASAVTAVSPANGLSAVLSVSVGLTAMTVPAFVVSYRVGRWGGLAFLALLLGLAIGTEAAAQVAAAAAGLLGESQSAAETAVIGVTSLLLVPAVVAGATTGALARANARREPIPPLLGVYVTTAAGA